MNHFPLTNNKFVRFIIMQNNYGYFYGIQLGRVHVLSLHSLTQYYLNMLMQSTLRLRTWLTAVYI